MHYLALREIQTTYRQHLLRLFQYEFLVVRWSRVVNCLARWFANNYEMRVVSWFQCLVGASQRRTKHFLILIKRQRMAKIETGDGVADLGVVVVG